MMTAPLVELAYAFPQSEIHVLVNQSWNSLFKNLPGIHRLWTLNKGSNLADRTYQLAKLAYLLRRENYDCVINLHASPSTATLAMVTGAKTRAIHFHGHHDQNRYSTVDIPGKGIVKPHIERDMDALRALGIHVPAGRIPCLTLQPTEIHEGQQFLKKLGLSKPILMINLGASRPTKSWPIERFAALAIEWSKRNRGGVLALADSKEGSLIHQFLLSVDELLPSMTSEKQRAEIRSQIAARNDFPLRVLASLLKQAAVVVGNDSGPKHLAIAVDTPTVTVFGPEHPFEWHPYSQERHPFLYIENLPCRNSGDEGKPAWCSLTQCDIEEHKCMRQIGVNAVLAEALRVARKE